MIFTLFILITIINQNLGITAVTQNLTLTSDDIINLMNGRSILSLDYESKTLNSSIYYNLFPQCQSICPFDKPCAVIESPHNNNEKCVAMSQATDYVNNQNIYYCPLQSTCCYSEICRKRVDKCDFFSKNYINEIISTLDFPTLDYLNNEYDRISPNNFDLINEMYKDLNPPQHLSEQCTKSCNGWINGLGSLMESDCPLNKTCKCNAIDQIKLIDDQNYPCKRVNNYETQSITTYHRLQSNNTLLIDSNDKIICDVNDICQNVDYCIDYSKYEEKEERKRQEETESEETKNQNNNITNNVRNYKANSNSNSNDTDGMSTGVVIGISIGAFVATVLLIIGIIYGVRRYKDNKNENDETPIEEASYHEM